MIPNIVYNQLLIGHSALKLISDEYRFQNNEVRPIVVRDSLILLDSAKFTDRWIGLKSKEVFSFSTVKNFAEYRSSKDLVLSGFVQQNIFGTGVFSNLRINNKNGVQIVEGGGFVVSEKLTLSEGEFKNSKNNNFLILDSGRIFRSPNGSITFEPILENKINVHFFGDGNIVTGVEIPKEQFHLTNLYAENVGELYLDRNVHVLDSLIVGAKINAIDDTLVLENKINPVYIFPNSQINGNFRRNSLTVGDTILLNAKLIWVRFATKEDLGDVVSLFSRVRSKTFHLFPQGQEKVERTFYINGIDKNDVDLLKGFRIDFGFAWRFFSDDVQIDESNGLVPNELVLQRWEKNSWIDVISDEKPKIDFYSNWAYGISNNVDRFGNFAIGLLQKYNSFVFRADVFLEGSYIKNQKNQMTTFLWSGGLIQKTDFSKYPYNMVKNIPSDFLKNVPDSIVDVVVVELRKTRNSTPNLIQIAYLRNDGRIVNELGQDLSFRIEDGIDSSGGEYFVAIRHRNHADIISEIPIVINNQTKNIAYNLTDPNLIEGGTSSLKLVYADEQGEQVYAMKGGFYVYDSKSLDKQLNFIDFYSDYFQYKETWINFTNVGLYDTDYNLDGIVDTKDFNIGWNNRILK
ncbi:MAG: hypothetical protein BWY04_01504 [candidate division CPR1 bacterium ADurb.Bin160]|uniref:Uncharacterized protein n=1 Tax=candidate division CPR1 bacterium ADurb.Bin160 TaxID=1852826 RepID=A0A1V5ZI83_9BACT|nr:MAG: hypothetical protein BWY04_01504 [candidate division CPR1 bacterium ADurb.Bin160]